MQFSPYIVLLALWTGASAQIARIFQTPSLQVPDEVTANIPFRARLWVEELSGRTDYVAGFRVYLAWARSESSRSYRERCYLNNNEPICNPTIELTNSHVYYKNTTFDVTIPASVGPSGKLYVLMIRTINTDGTYYGMRLESNVFNLSGGTGAWARFETQGNTLWGDDGIACSGYDCVRQCAVVAALNNTSSDNGYRPCANSCPNVFIDPSSTRGGQATASLTRATPCNRTPTSTSATTYVTNTAGTSTRRVAAAAGTGAATPAFALNQHLFGIFAFVGIARSVV